jgi:hypothetical protein
MGPSQDKRFIGELAISLPWAHSALTPFNELMAGPVRVHHGFMRIGALEYTDSPTHSEYSGGLMISLALKTMGP